MFVLLFAVSAYALLIGNLYSGETVQNILVAVCDLENSRLSRELMRAVMEADQYEYVETLTDEFQAVEMLNSGKLAGVLIIPEDFSKRFYNQQPIELAFLTSGYIWHEIGMIDIIKWISMLQPVHYITMDFRDLALVGASATYFSHTVVLFLVGMIFMLVLYILLYYLIEVHKQENRSAEIFSK